MASPAFVVVGHVVRDVVPGGWRPGGTATYAATQARRLGCSVGVVTHVGRDLDVGDALRGVDVVGSSSEDSTTFQNTYEDGKRTQRVLARADAISLDDVPGDWRAAPISLLGPVCEEVPAGLARALSGALVAVAAQGWLRRVDKQQRVRRRAWQGEPFWTGCDVLFVSDEDLGARREQLTRWCAEVPIVVITRNRRGARVHADGSWREIDAFPANEVDPTGAGDVFAAAFLVSYHEAGDIGAAMRFGAAASACAIEAPGIESIAGRIQIEQRIARHPEVALR